jgi:hypothetical protein
MRGLASPPRLPNLRHPAKSPTGSRFVPKHEILISGPGDPPPGFLNGQNSLTEWVCYWALAKIFNNPRGQDYRKPPFYGGFPDWGYQVAELGGHVRALGSAVVDFVIYQGGTIIGIRIQTERFHIFTDSRRHAADAFQLAQLEANGMRVVDVYDTQLLPVGDGQKAVVAMKRAIGRLPTIDPIIAGTAFRASRIKSLG